MIVGSFENAGMNMGVQNMASLYNKIANESERLVRESYAKYNKEVRLPIDINLIAKYLKIEVIKDDLNMAEYVLYNRRLGITMKKNGESFILVDNSVSYKTCRYAIANGVGLYLLNETKNMFKGNYAIPLIPQSLEEIAADSIALFLLMPVSIFKDEFLQYLNACEDRPLDVDAWLQYLGEKCQITQFNLAIGYQQMKQVLCYQRQKEFEDCDYDISKFANDKYSKIFA